MRRVSHRGRPRAKAQPVEVASAAIVGVSMRTSGSSSRQARANSWGPAGSGSGVTRVRAKPGAVLESKPRTAWGLAKIGRGTAVDPDPRNLRPPFRQPAPYWPPVADNEDSSSAPASSIEVVTQADRGCGKSGCNRLRHPLPLEPEPVLGTPRTGGRLARARRRRLRRGVRSSLERWVHRQASHPASRRRQAVGAPRPLATASDRSPTHGANRADLRRGNPSPEPPPYLRSPDPRNVAGNWSPVPHPNRPPKLANSANFSFHNSDRGVPRPPAQ